MRWILSVAAAVLIAGCSDERNFDERYDDTANEISSRAQSIDANLADSQAE